MADRLEEAKQQKIAKVIEQVTDEQFQSLKKENQELQSRLNQLEQFVSNMNNNFEFMISRIDKMDIYQNQLGAQLRVNVNDLNSRLQATKAAKTPAENPNGPNK